MTGIVLFVVVMSQVDLRAMFAAMRDADAGWVLAGLALQVGLLVLKGVRWHLMHRGAGAHGQLARSFGEFFESYAIGVITPGRVGEFMKAGYAGHGTGALQTVLTVVIERGLDVGLFLIIAGGALVWTGLADVPPIWGLVVLALGVGSVGVSTLLLLSRRTLLVLERRVTPGSGRFVLPVARRGAGERIAIYGLSVVSTASHFVSCYALGIALGLGASFWYLSGGVAIAGLFNLLPITVMGLGTREVTFLFVFDAFPTPQILAFSALVLLTAQVGGGLIAMLCGQLFLRLARPR